MKRQTKAVQTKGFTDQRSRLDATVVLQSQEQQLQTRVVRYYDKDSVSRNAEMEIVKYTDIQSDVIIWLSNQL